MAKTEPIGPVMERWGRTHGLAFAEWCDFAPATPLLRDGALFGYNSLVGVMCGHPVTVCLYTLVYAAGDGGSTSVDFTIAVVENVVSPADGVVLRPARPPLGPVFRRDAGLRGARAVELESGRMTRTYRLLIAPATPEGPVRRLFEPVVMDWCAEEENVFFELEQQVLVVAFPGIRSEPEDLDDVWNRTDWLLGRILAAAR